MAHSMFGASSPDENLVDRWAAMLRACYDIAMALVQGPTERLAYIYPPPSHEWGGDAPRLVAVRMLAASIFGSRSQAPSALLRPSAFALMYVGMRETAGARHSSWFGRPCLVHFG